MPTLLLQISLKQWDKSQRGEADCTLRDNLSTRHTLQSQPEFMILETPCLLDQNAINLAYSNPTWSHGKQAGRLIKMGLQQDGSGILDRFLIHRSSDNRLLLSFFETPQNTIQVGEISDKWIEAKYEWRYRTEVNNEIFWQYEEVTLNVALAGHYAEDFFLTNQPFQTFYKDLK